MNNQLLTTLGIDANGDLKKILEQLEEKQYEYLERSETASSPERKKEIEELLAAIDKEISVVKEEIKTVSSSLILDTGEPAEEEKKSAAKKKEEEKAAKAEKEAKDAQLEDKIAKMKNKEAEKQAKEAEKKQKEAEKQAQSQAQSQQGSGSGASGSANNGNANVQGGSMPAAPAANAGNGYELNQALADYKKGNYNAAFPVFKKHAEQGDNTIQYIVGQMYLNGHGVKSDADRALFWFKKSAQSGNRDGQYMYGAYLLSNHNNERKRIKEGFKYLQMAAEAGDEDAMKKYIQAATANLGDKRELKKAIAYCDKLKSTDADSFNREQYEANKQQLKVLKKGKKTKFPWGAIIFIIIVILGCRGCIACSGLGDYFDKAEEEASSYEEVMSDEEYPSESVEPQVQEIRIRITASSANIRSGAGTDYNVVGTGAAGEEFVATGNTQATSGGTLWYEIYLDETRTTTGWASQKVLEVIE